MKKPPKINRQWRTLRNGRMHAKFKSVCVRKRVRLTRAESTSVEYRERYKVARAAGREKKVDYPPSRIFKFINASLFFDPCCPFLPPPPQFAVEKLAS